MKKKILILLLSGVLTCCLANQVFALKYNANAGCVPEIVTYQPGGALAVSPSVFGNAQDFNKGDLPPGTTVQYIWIGDEQLIDDPNSDGSVRSSGGGTGVSADDQLTNATGNTIGNDSDTGNKFSGTAAKFFHYFKYETPSGVNSFYVRVWDKDPSDATAKFGESNLFQANVGTDTFLTPNNVGLSTFQALFPKEAPSGNVVIAAGVPVFNSSAIKWEVSLSANTAFGARRYEFYQCDDAVKTNPVLIDNVINSQGRPSENGVGVVPLSWTGLTELKTYYVFVKAWNAFGSLDSNVVEVKTDEFPDLNAPVPITDLTATAEGQNKIILSWTAPYDLDKMNQPAACYEYDIRVSTEAIIDKAASPFTAAITNPNDRSNWDGAVSVYSFPGFVITPTSPVPPVLFSSSATQSISIASGSLGGYFFGIKATDTPSAKPIKRWSYVSNIAGVGGGGGGNPASQEVLNFYKPATLGVNQFQITIDPAKPIICVESDGAEHPFAANTVIDLVKEIDGIAGSKVVTTIGWWNANPGSGQEQKMEGYIINNNNVPIPANWTAGLKEDGTEPLKSWTTGTTYQLTVSQPVGGFTIKN